MKSSPAKSLPKTGPVKPVSNKAKRPVRVSREQTNENITTTTEKRSSFDQSTPASRPSVSDTSEAFSPSSTKSSASNIVSDTLVNSSSPARDNDPTPSPSMEYSSTPPGEQSNFQAFPSRMNPVALKKNIPKKSSNDLKASSLDGMAVVFTGVFQSTDRSSVEEQARSFGVLVRSAVSGKTDYLVHGYQLEDGRSYEEGSKFRKATEIISKSKGHVKIINEDEWFAIIEAATENSSIKEDDSPQIPSPNAVPKTNTSPHPRKRMLPSDGRAGSSPPAKKKKADEASPLKGSPLKASKMDGITAVFTGVFEGKDRSVIENEARALGVLVRSSISGKTDYLVHGKQLEDGRSFDEGKKYKDAYNIANGNKKGVVKILTEEEWNQLINRNVSSSKEPEAIEIEVPTKRQNPQEPQERRPIMSTDESVEPSKMWVDKFKPSKPDDILGNKPIINKLLEWLQDWHTVCILGHKKTPQGKPRWGGGGFPEPERINAKACMLSGPPGIGKTSSAIACANYLGFSVNEFNASDTRSATELKKIQFLTQAGQSLLDLGYFTTLSNKKTQKTVIIFDEMDGLSAGDRGGAQLLGRLIDDSRVPIICICNDRYSAKVKSIGQKCLDLKFNRPNINEISRRLMSVVSSEGHQIEANALTNLIQSSNNDIRSCLNELQSMISGRQSNLKKGVALRYNDLVNTHHKDEGTLSMSPFDICKELLTSSTSNKLSFRDREELFWIDYDLVPKLVSQNYINAAAGLGGWGGPQKASVSPQEELNQLRKIMIGAQNISFGDQLNSMIWSKQAWNLLPDLGFYTTIIPSYQCSKFLSRADFPQYMGKISTRNKNRRYLKELNLAFNDVKLNLTNLQLRNYGYLEILYQKAVQPMAQNKTPEECLSKLNEIGLTRALLVDNLVPIRLKSQEQLYESIDSKVRASLTRLENASKKEFITASKTVHGTGTGGDDSDDTLNIKPVTAKAKGKGKGKGKAKARGKGKGKAKARV